MSDQSRRRTFIIIVLLLLAAIVLLLVRCRRAEPPVEPAKPSVPAGSQPVKEADRAPTAPSVSAPVTALPDEILTPATLTAPAQVPAGSPFRVVWTGPDNVGDFVTLVEPSAAEHAYASYANTKEGSTLGLTAPVQAGDYELRYVANRSKKILGRVALTVTPVAATLTAPAEVVLGASISVAWTGPDNPSDYITIVAAGTPDGQYGNYTNTSAGSPLSVVAPPTAGPAELRYMTGQGAKVLGRKAVTIVMPSVKLTAPAECIAGSTIAVEWSGPNNDSDYITVVARDAKDGQYGNYTNTSNGSPLKLVIPIMTGEAELRYMTGRGAKVLARRPLLIQPTKVTLSAPDRATAGESIEIQWTGPSYPSDYITIVAPGTPEGQYGKYEYTTEGSPLQLPLPPEPGIWEIRYMTGQGAKVIGKRTVTTTPR